MRKLLALGALAYLTFPTATATAVTLNRNIPAAAEHGIIENAGYYYHGYYRPYYHRYYGYHHYYRPYYHGY